MHVLYYLEPSVELQNPAFRYGALRNQVLGQAAQLRKTGARVTVLCGEGVAFEVARKGLSIPADIDIRVVPHRELQVGFDSQSVATRAWYEGSFTSEQLERYSALLKKHLPPDYRADALVSWESPIPFLRNMFPAALPVHMMPGFVSKAPFPELVSVDCEGLFQRSTLVTQRETFRGYVPNPDERAFLSKLRAELCEGFLRPRCPFPRAMLDPGGRFSSLVLLPLQVSGYYAFDDNSPFRSQFEFLLYVLDRIAPDVGVVVTQYVSKHTSDQPIRRSNEDYLRARYPNFIYSKEFDEVAGVSQYLLAEVDGVVTVSSSLGLQAALWNKPTFCVGKSHVNAVAQPVAIEDVGSFLRSRSKQDGEFDGLLALLLTRMQPLARTRLYEGTWFADFLTRGSQAYREGVRGLDLLVPLHSDLNAYAEEWISHARLGAASKELRKTTAGARALTLRGRPDLAVEQLQSAQYEVVSFDIFDTLIQRPIERPTDVFKLMVSAARKIAGGKLWTFAAARVTAEREAREKRLAAGHDELSLDDIYDELAELCGLTQEERAAVAALERETEQRLLFSRPFGRRCFEAARAAGKRVVLVSDMYLPRALIEQTLQHCGITGYEKLYLSHELGLRKNDGRLFGHLVADLGVPAPRILHVGDNPKGDVTSAHLHELDTMRAPKAIDLMRAHEPWNALYPHARAHRSLAEATVLGVWASQMFEDPAADTHLPSHFDGSAHRLGYLALGWLFLAFAKWLAEEAKRDGITDLYFLSRDGEIIKKAYDRVAPHIQGAPKSHYVLASRRVASVAQLVSEDDLIVSLDYASGELPLAEFMERRFGLSAEQIDARALQKAGFANAQERIVPGKDKRRLGLLLAALGPTLLDLAKGEREALLQHLTEQGLNSSAKPAVVDIGYAGSMQRAIAEIAKLPSLGGYYFVTFVAARELVAQGLAVRAFAADFVDPHVSWHPFLEHRWCFEVMFSNCEGSVVRWERGEHGALRAQKEATEGDASKHRFLRQVHAGVLSFIDDYLRHWAQDLPQLSFDSFGPQRVFLDFLTRPQPCDAALLEGVPFDNTFAGVTARFLVPPSKEGESSADRLGRALWKQGTAALLSAQQADVIAPDDPQSARAATPTALKTNPKKAVKPKRATSADALVAKGPLRRKLDKLRANPGRFLAESKYGFLRSLHALYRKDGH